MGRERRVPHTGSGAGQHRRASGRARIARSAASGARQHRRARERAAQRARASDDGRETAERRPRDEAAAAAGEAYPRGDAGHDLGRALDARQLRAPARAPASRRGRYELRRRRRGPQRGFFDRPAIICAARRSGTTRGEARRWRQEDAHARRARAHTRAARWVCFGSPRRARACACRVGGFSGRVLAAVGRGVQAARFRHLNMRSSCRRYNLEPPAKHV